MSEQNTTEDFGERVLILETGFNKVHTKDTYVIITDKDDNNVVVMDINELDSVYNIIHTVKE
jgi:hypothetical protein